MTAIESSSYNFRNKFKAQIEKFGLKQSFFESTFDTAMKMSKENFKTLLWNLSFEESASNALASLGLSVNKENFSKELITPLRNELRYQFTVKICNGEDFLIPSFATSSEEGKIFDRFSKKFGTDKILVSEIGEIALNFVTCASGEHIERTIFLLKSKGRENFQYGGLRNLGLKDYEASALLPKAEALGTFISELYQIVLENGGSSQTAENVAAVTTPFANLGALIEQNGIELPESCDESTTTQEDTSASTSPDDVTSTAKTQEASSLEGTNVLEVKNPISPVVDQIIAHADLVDDFLAIYRELMSAGLDIQYLISKRFAVQELLDGYFDLVEAASENL